MPQNPKQETGLANIHIFGLGICTRSIGEMSLSRLFVSPLAHVPDTGGDDPFVDVALPPCLVTTLGWATPWTDGVDVTL